MSTLARSAEVVNRNVTRALIKDFNARLDAQTGGVLRLQEETKRDERIWALWYGSVKVGELDDVAALAFKHGFELGRTYPCKIDITNRDAFKALEDAAR